ncbi:hypothetical protein RCL1_006609 [Eukaryota sp. TZLM3-RCL]
MTDPVFEALTALVSGNHADADAFLQQLQKSPESLSSLTNILLQNCPSSVRHVSAILLRRCILQHWTASSVELQNFIKDSLLTLISQPSDHLFSVAVADVIAVIGAATISSNSWPNLLNFIAQCISNPTPHLISPSLYVIHSLLERTGGSLRNYYAPVASYLQSLLVNESQQIVVKSLLTLTELIQWLDSSKAHKSIILNLIPSFLTCLKRGGDVSIKAFDCIDEILSSPAKMLKNADFLKLFECLVELLTELNQNVDVNYNIINRLLYTLNLFFESNVKCFSKNTVTVIDHVINQLGFILSLKIIDYDLDSITSQNHIQSSAFLTLSAITEHLSINLISSPMLNLFNKCSNSDVNYRVVAATSIGLLLSRLVIEDSRDNNLEQVFNYLLILSSDCDFGVVCAALAAVSNMSESFSQLQESQSSSVFIDFAKKMLDQSVSLILQCSDDTTSAVTSSTQKDDVEWRSWSVIEHLVEIDSLSQSFLSNVFNRLSSRLFHLLTIALENPINLSKSRHNYDLCFKRFELLFSVLSSFATVSSYLFSNNFMDYLNLTNTVLSLQYPQAREKGLLVCGRAIEFLGLLLSSTFQSIVESQSFIVSIAPSAVEIVLNLVRIPGCDLLSNFVLSFVARIIEIIKEESTLVFNQSRFLIDPFLSADLAGDFLKHLKQKKRSSQYQQSISNQSFSLVDDDDSSDDDVDETFLSSSANDTLSALSCISSMSQHAPTCFSSLISTYVPLVSNCLTSPVSDVRIESIRCLTHIFLCQAVMTCHFSFENRTWKAGFPVDCKFPSDLRALSLLLINNLIEIISDDDDCFVVDAALECLRECLGVCGSQFLTVDVSIIDIITSTILSVLKGEASFQSNCRDVDSEDDVPDRHQSCDFSYLVPPLRNAFDSTCDVLAGLAYSMGPSFSSFSSPFISFILELLSQCSDMEVLSTCVGVLADITSVDVMSTCQLIGNGEINSGIHAILKLIFSSLSCKYEVLVRNGAVLASAVADVSPWPEFLPSQMKIITEQLKSLVKSSNFERDSIDNFVSSYLFITAHMLSYVQSNLIDLDSVLSHVCGHLPLKVDTSEDPAVAFSLLKFLTQNLSSTSHTLIFKILVKMLAFNRLSKEGKFKDENVVELRQKSLEFIKFYCSSNNLNSIGLFEHEISFLKQNQFI